MRRTNNIIEMHSTDSVFKSMTFGELVALFFSYQERKGLSPFTLKHDRENVSAILQGMPETVALHEVTTSNLEVNVFDVMREKHLSPTTINGRRKTLAKIYHFAVLQGYCRQDPTLGLARMMHTSDGIPSLTADQIRKLLAQPNRTTFTGLRDYTLMLLMIDCGIRLNEALNLNIAQIDVVDRQIKNVIGKNRRTESIPISDRMAKQLDIYLHARGDLGTSIVFVSLQDRGLGRKTFQERLKNYGDSAKIKDVRVSPHTLRHTFAKQWILAGGDVFSLQKILRHSTMDMVKRYIHLWGHEVQKVHDQYSPLNHLPL